MRKVNNEDKIILDYYEDIELFDETAEKWANKISRTKKTQLRNFYDYILDLENRLKKEQNTKEILAFTKMLNSKVAYARSRGVASNEFQDMMKQCISQIDKDNIEKKLKCFKLFFEAVLGFFEGRD